MPQPDKSDRERGRLAMLPHLVAFYSDEGDDPRAISYRGWGLVGDGWTIAVVPDPESLPTVSIHCDVDEAEDELALSADHHPARHMTVRDIRAVEMPFVSADEVAVAALAPDTASRVAAGTQGLAS